MHAGSHEPIGSARVGRKAEGVTKVFLFGKAQFSCSPLCMPLCGASVEHTPDRRSLRCGTYLELEVRVLTSDYCRNVVVHTHNINKSQQTHIK